MTESSVTDKYFEHLVAYALAVCKECRELQKLQVVDDFVVVESSAEFQSRRVFRHTGRDVMRDEMSNNNMRSEAASDGRSLAIALE
jgi:hypothetical protein